MPAIDERALLEEARQVLETEAAAIRALIPRLDGDFIAAVRLMLGCKGRVVVCGMGKSGHIARKIAATMASTGTPAFFLHPGEAAHGDLGMVTPQDVLLGLSNSGESDELLALLPYMRRQGIPVVAMTGNPSSNLAREAQVHLYAGATEEACPLGLAPTSSTTAALALGDALAVALLSARGFGKDDFALTHPAGRLGKRLLVHVEDVMHQGEEMPRVQDVAPLPQVLDEITRKRLGFAAVVDAQGKLAGVFTDGDLRRAFVRFGDLRTVVARDAMTLHPATIHPRQLAVDAVALMEARKITGLLVVDDAGLLVGALHLHDLFQAGVV